MRLPSLTERRAKGYVGINGCAHTIVGYIYLSIFEKESRKKTKELKDLVRSLAIFA